jgi:polygalacturonase
MRKPLLIVAIAGLLVGVMLAAPPETFNVRSYGAVGGGKTLDTPAINQAIEAAAAAGGGTVLLPAGDYLCYSIRLKSNICLQLEPGATIIAAEPSAGDNRYDLPEPNEWDMYQDFGHSHWQNSLIWGIGLENVSIVGPGRIYGKGLTRRGPGPRRPAKTGDTPTTLLDRQGRSVDALTPSGAAPSPSTPGQPAGPPVDAVLEMNGLGNKAISLKLCRNVLLRDITIQQGGHFALLATGVDNLTIDNVKVDTNRDGFDIDCCVGVRISNCTVNSPNDDAIVLKSSYALGRARATEDVTITNCQVSGFDPGTLLDGTFGRTQKETPDHDGVTGRIKFGTESNGGFKNIAISNCVFDRCRGLALETVDGGLLEDVTVSNVTMRDVTTSPFFLRLGARMRGPEGVPVGALRRVRISNVTVYDAYPRFASIISGIPGHPIEDVRLSHIRIYYRGDGTVEQAAFEPPEKEASYPEPSMFGDIPAYGFFIRHAKDITLDDVEVRCLRDDLRPAFVLTDVQGVELRHVKAQRFGNVPAVRLNGVENFTAHASAPIPEVSLLSAAKMEF